MRGAERTSAPAFTEPGRRVEGGLISPEASLKFTRRGAEEPSGFNTMDDFVYNLTLRYQLPKCCVSVLFDKASRIQVYSNVSGGGTVQEYVTLVDENDHVVGSAEKIDAHKNPKLHRAFSIFIANSKGELLIQQRAGDKYHCAGMWANTCCGHPRPGESLEAAAHRRLQEEMGFDTRMVKVFSFIYKSEFENGLTEQEYDHVFVGKWDGTPKKNINEVADYKWISKDILEEDMKKNPEIYTIWFKIAWEILLVKIGDRL